MGTAPECNVASDEWAVAVVLHPHPDYGGNRHNIVVDALFRRLPSAGVTAARFDFSSSGPVDAAQNVVDAVDTVVADRPGRPVIVAGYSFGADVGLTVVDERIAGWFLVAPPLRLVALDAMAAALDPRPKGIAVPELDQFSPPHRVRELTADWTATTITTVPGADHFLAGATEAVADAAVTWALALRDGTAKPR